MTRLASTTRYLGARPGDPYPKGTAEAILLAVEPFAGKERTMLTRLGVLSPDGVPRDILGTGTETDDALENLVDACLVTIADTGAVIMHRLTQQVVREHADDLPAAVEAVIDAVRAAAVPRDEAWKHRKRGDDLVRQVEALWDHTTSPAVPEDTERALQALRDWSVKQLTGSVSFDRAILVGERVLADRRRALGEVATRRAFGDSHPDTITSAHNLAGATPRPDGRTTPSVSTKPTSAPHVRSSGRRTPQPNVSADGLAGAYKAAGRLDDAIDLFEHTLTASRRVFGEHHPTTIDSIITLGCVRYVEERVDEARTLFEEAATAAEQTMGPRHPITRNARAPREHTRGNRTP